MAKKKKWGIDLGCLTCGRIISKGLGTCEAFTKGIPFGVLIGTLDHRKKLRGDGGLQYKAKDEKKAKSLFRGSVDNLRETMVRLFSGTEGSPDDES